MGGASWPQASHLARRSGQSPAPPGAALRVTAVDYQEAISYLLSFADFERSGRFADRPDVGPVLALLHRLGDPHLGRATVHVAGSKGKGSVCAMAEVIIRAAGLRTGLYTSPHLHSYTERVRIDGEPISEEMFARLLAAIQPQVDALRRELPGRSLVTFDLLTALAFMAFREAGAQAQVIEVGLGGRLDSTNVFKSKEVAVITPISLEHTAILGGTVEQIAREKAAIISPGCAVVLAPQLYPEVRRVVREFAARAGAELIDVEREYRWQVLSRDLRGQEIRVAGPVGTVEARLPLPGRHQVENAATALAAIAALAGRTGARPALTAAATAGLSRVAWPGRFEVLRERPLVIADGAHNRDSARRLVETLREYAGRDRASFVVGASADKDIGGLAEEIAPLAARVFAARADHPRAMEPEVIVRAFESLDVPAEDAGGVGQALGRALEVTDIGGVICVAGSLFVAAEAREHLQAPDRGAGG